MLDWDPDKRVSAQKMLEHPWLKMQPSYDTKMTDEELAEYLQRQQTVGDIMDPPMHGEEMSKLDDTDYEINGGDRENNNGNIFSDDYDDTSSTSEGEQEM